MSNANVRFPPNSVATEHRASYMLSAKHGGEMSGKVFLMAFVAVCWLAVAVMNIADHAATWKIVVTGIAAVAFAFETFKAWKATRA